MKRVTDAFLVIVIAALLFAIVCIIVGPPWHRTVGERIAFVCVALSFFVALFDLFFGLKRAPRAPTIVGLVLAVFAVASLGASESADLFEDGPMMVVGLGAAIALSAISFAGVAAYAQTRPAREAADGLSKETSAHSKQRALNRRTESRRSQ